jgi:hypothetical protein
MNPCDEKFIKVRCKDVATPKTDGVGGGKQHTQALVGLDLHRLHFKFSTTLTRNVDKTRHTHITFLQSSLQSGLGNKMECTAMRSQGRVLLWIVRITSL